MSKASTSTDDSASPTLNPSPQPFVYTPGDDTANFIAAGATIGSLFGPIGTAAGGAAGWLVCYFICDKPGN